MRPPLVDLHTHTTASDGSDTPAELIRLAVKSGLTAIAVTDHDTTSGLDEAEAEGCRLGIDIVRGCELSTESEYGEVHILGLWLPRNSATLEDALIHLRNRRFRRNLLMLERLADIGMPMTHDEVAAQAGGQSVGRPHIAKAMLAKGYIDTYDRAFLEYIGRGKPAFVPMEPFMPEEATSLLASVGATAVLAHPMLIRTSNERREELVKRLTDYGLTALEAYHSEHSFADEHYIVKLAAKYGLGLSGGSDYHGTSKPQVQLGRGRGSLRVTEALFDLLVARRRSRGLPV